MAEYKGWLYAGAINNDDGSEIWRSQSGDPDSWSRVASGGFNNPNNLYVASFTTFDGCLYAGLVNSKDGDAVWRTQNGTD